LHSFCKSRDICAIASARHLIRPRSAPGSGKMFQNTSYCVAVLDAICESGLLSSSAAVMMLSANDANNSRLSLIHMDSVNGSPEPQRWYRNLILNPASKVCQRVGWPFTTSSTFSRSQPSATVTSSQLNNLPIRASPGTTISRDAASRVLGRH
jgi:hypothetical protein